LALYDYTALARDGREVKGREAAPTLETLESALRRRQLVLLEAKSVRERGVGLDLTLAFVTEFSRLLESGIVMERALAIIAEDAREPKLAALAQGLRAAIKRGEPLSRALSQAGRFDPMLIAMVKVGEASGKLGEILLHLERHYEGVNALRRDITATLAYPMVLVVLSVLSIAGLAVFVIPVFRDIFADQKHDLPLGTEIVFAASDWIAAYGAWTAAAVFAALAALALAERRSPGLRRALHSAWLQVPVAGELSAAYETARLTKVLGVMLGAGVPLIQAMELAGEVVSNAAQRAGVAAAADLLRRGGSVTAALDAVPALPRIAQRLVRIGNETGKLPESCSRIAQILEAEVRNRLRTIVALADPLIIVSMGGLIGFVVVSMLLAVFGLAEVG